MLLFFQIWAFLFVCWCSPVISSPLLSSALLSSPIWVSPLVLSSHLLLSSHLFSSLLLSSHLFSDCRGGERTRDDWRGGERRRDDWSISSPLLMYVLFASERSNRNLAQHCKTITIRKIIIFITIVSDIAYATLTLHSSFPLFNTFESNEIEYLWYSVWHCTTAVEQQLLLGYGDTTWTNHTQNYSTPSY